MIPLIMVAYIAATIEAAREGASAAVMRLATALRHAAERLAPHHPPSAPEKVQWNWCPQCAQPVDLPDECHDGSECRCHGCRTIYVVTEHEGGTWSLSIQDEEDEPEEIPETRFTIHETETAVLVDNANGETVAAFSKLSDGDVAIAWVTDEATERARADAKRYVAEAHPPEDEAAVIASWGDGGCGLGADGQPVEEPEEPSGLQASSVLEECRARIGDLKRTIEHAHAQAVIRRDKAAEAVAALTRADVADPRALAREMSIAEGAIPGDGWPETESLARAYLAVPLNDPRWSEALRARIGCYRAAMASSETGPAAVVAEAPAPEPPPCSVCGLAPGEGHSAILHDMAVIATRKACSTCAGANEPCPRCIAAGYEMPRCPTCLRDADDIAGPMCGEPSFHAQAAPRVSGPLHFTRDTVDTLCGGSVHGTRATSNADRWNDTIIGERCAGCAAQMGGAP